MGIDWEEMLGAEGDEMAQAYETIVCDAMALETRDNYYNYDIRDYGVRTKTQTGSKDRKKKSSYLCKVAGVKFNNPDGESRQDIIKGIIDKYGRGSYWTGQGKLKAVKGETVCQNWKESAIEVYVRGKLIGFVPQSSKREVVENERTQSCSVLVQLTYHPEFDVCTAKLFEQTRKLPTARMENTVKKILKNNPRLTPPEKTFDAYRQFLNSYYGGGVDQLKHKERINRY